MAKSKTGLKSKLSAEASAAYSGGTAATADRASGNGSPTIGKSIPIITGGARPSGEVIWAQTRRDKNGECRGDIAVCFGRNPFNRPLSLRAIAINGIDIYSRKDGTNIDPAGVIRFYDGTQTAADPLIVEAEGAASTPAWVGYVYAVIENVLLDGGERKYHAEFSDNSTIGNTPSAAICDPALAGIDLVYEPTSGLYYGLEAPLSGQSYIIVSDGCRVLSRKKIRGIFNAEYINPGSPNDDFYAENIFPIPCTYMVIVTGSGAGSERPTAESPAYDLGVCYSPIFNPFTGKAVWNGQQRTDDDLGINPVFPRNGLGPLAGPEGGWGVEWKIAYHLPGSNGRIAYLRTYDKENAFAVVDGSSYWIGAFYAPGIVDQIPPALGGGNMACQIVNCRSGQFDSWYQDVARARTNDDPYRPRINDWNVRDFPDVDDILWCKTGVSDVTLASVKHTVGGFTVYFISHSQSGVSVTALATVALPTGWTSQDMAYDATREVLIIGANDPGDSLATGRIYSITLSGSVSFQFMTTGYRRVVPARGGSAVDGKVAVANDDFSKIGVFDTDTEETTDIYDADAPTSTPTVDLTRNMVSIPSVTGRTSYAISQVTVDDIPLADVITDICSLKGYDPADLVFEGFSGLLVRGMTISSTTKVSDLLNRLGQLYGFVFAETDGKLKFRNRRNDDGSVIPDWTLTDADLVEAPENITVQRQAATSVLGSLSLTWLDPDRDYESNNVMARRIVGVLSGESGARDEEISLPFAIDAEQARRMLFKSFYAQSEGETRVGFSVGPSHLQIEPGDLIEITADGSTRIVQARRVTHNADLNTLSIEADSFMAQTTPAIGSAGGNVTPPVSGAISGAYIHLDIPLITATDYSGTGSVRQYHGITTLDAESWGGADFYRSGDGVNFTKLLEYDVAPLVVATASDALGDSPQSYVMEEGASLTITVIAGAADAFQTVTYQEMMSDLTLCAYGRAGAWELISFQTVTDNLDGTFTLSDIERGLYGTQQLYFADGLGLVHEAGDYVCLLDASLVRSTVRPASEIGRDDVYSVVTADVDISAAMKPRHVLSGVSVRPPPVANVIAEHVAGSSDLVITWDATTPIPHTWEDTGANGVMPETYTYTIDIIRTGGLQTSVITTDTTATWTDYGSLLGATALAHEVILEVAVTVSSPIWGDSFTTTVREIREV